MSQREAVLVHEKLLELEPKIFAFDGRLKEMTAAVQSIVALSPGAIVRGNLDESEITKIHDDFWDVTGTSDPVLACKAMAGLVLASVTSIESLIEHGARARGPGHTNG